jgi:hypothetical protein
MINVVFIDGVIYLYTVHLLIAQYLNPTKFMFGLFD